MSKKLIKKFLNPAGPIVVTEDGRTIHADELTGNLYITGSTQPYAVVQPETIIRSAAGAKEAYEKKIAKEFAEMYARREIGFDGKPRVVGAPTTTFLSAAMHLPFLLLGLEENHLPQDGDALIDVTLAKAPYGMILRRLQPVTQAFKDATLEMLPHSVLRKVVERELALALNGEATGGFTYTAPVYSTQYTTRPTIQSEVSYKPWRSSWGGGEVKGNEATSYFWSHKPNLKFELVKDVEPRNYSVHFKTDQGALTHGEKLGLFANVANEVPLGGRLSTWGSLTRGGLHGLSRFGDYGMNLVGTRLVTDRAGNVIEIPVWQRPITQTSSSNLSLRERLGLSKGAYNDLNQYLKEGLLDLEDFMNSALYKTVPYLEPKTNYLRWSYPSEGYKNALLTRELAPNYNSRSGYWDVPGGKLGLGLTYDNSVYPKYMGTEGWETTLESGEGVGEIRNIGNGFIMTSPKTDAIDSGLPLQIVDLTSEAIPKDVVRNFWKAVNGSLVPGTYLSADNGAAPLGSKLISIYKNLGHVSETGSQAEQAGLKSITTLNDIYKAVNEPTRFSTHGNGLSFDSFESIVKLGLRPGLFSLRWSSNGMGDVNPQTFYNRDLYNAYQQMERGEITKLQFLNQYNEYAKRIGARFGKIIGEGTRFERVFIPHPFLYSHKQGGKINF